MTEQTKTFGKYEILGELGRGGFATVYRAKDTTLGREVALKLLDPSRTWELGFVERFYQEARIAAQLKHPNIITVYEIGEIDGQLFIAMELADEGTLAELLEGKGRLSPEESTELLTPIADALDYAHAQGIIHRDIKPANFMLDLNRDGSVRPILSDFGLVKALSHSTELTRSGTVLGTPKYMAPEQIDPDLQHLLGPATDIYALGIVVFQMFTGQVPFEGNSTQVSYAHVHKQPPSPIELRSDLSSAISAAILKALAKQPEDRFSKATEFVQALESGETSDPITEQPPMVIPPPEPTTTSIGSSGDVATPNERKKEEKGGAKPKRHLHWWWLVVPGILLAVVLAIIVFSTDILQPQEVAPATGVTEEATDESFSCKDASEQVSAIGSDDCNRTIELATQFIDAGCKDDTLWLSRAYCYDDLGQNDAALADFTTAIELNPGESWHYLGRSEIHRQMGNQELRLADLNKAISVAPGDPQSYFYRAEYYHNQGDWLAAMAAMADITRAVELGPTVPDYYDSRGQILSPARRLQGCYSGLREVPGTVCG